MANLTPFGVAVKKRLIDIGCNQKWLIDNNKSKTGLFIDSSYINKLLTGKIKSARVVAVISEILDISL